MIRSAYHKVGGSTAHQPWQCQPFALVMYGNGKTAISPKPSPAERKLVDAGRVRLAPDDTTPIPRPSRYNGRRQDVVTRDRAQGKMTAGSPAFSRPSPDLFPAQIDNNVLTIAEPKRIRDKGSSFKSAGYFGFDHTL
jgi:hypothetical protein